MTIGSLALISSQAFSLVNFRGPLISALVARGTQVYALAPDFDEVLRKRVEALGAVPVDYSISRAGLNPLRDLVDLLVLARLLRRLRPEATLAYFIKPVIYGSLAAWMARVPNRYSLVTGLGFVFARDPQAHGIRRAMLRSVVGRLYGFALSRNRKVVFQNEDDIETLIGSGLVERRKVALVPGTGVDLSHYAVAPPVKHPPVFVMVARMLREKGVCEFVEAARKVKARCPEARFVLVGGTDPNPGSVTLAELQAWVSEGAVEWSGQVVDVRPWLRQASVFVLPSYYREGVPRGNQEAMAMGRPVITTDWIGCRDTVVDGINGFLVPVRDVVALDEAMQRFIDDPELIARMGSEGRRIAEARFDVHDLNGRLLAEIGL